MPARWNEELIPVGSAEQSQECRLQQQNVDSLHTYVNSPYLGTQVQNSALATILHLIIHNCGVTEVNIGAIFVTLLPLSGGGLTLSLNWGGFYDHSDQVTTAEVALDWFSAQSFIVLAAFYLLGLLLLSSWVTT